MAGIQPSGVCEVTPEQVLAALVSHSQKLDFGTPDPLIIEARDSKIGKARPINWRLLGRSIDEQIELWPATRSALGKQKIQISRYSIAAVAVDALLGMFDRNWHALQLSIGVGEAVRPILVRRLIRTANRMKNEERIWPNRIRRRCCPCGRAPAPDYVLDLVELAVRHLEDPYNYRHQRTRAEWFGISESHWHAVARRPFDQTAAHVWSWYYAGIGHIQHRIIQIGQRLE